MAVVSKEQCRMLLVIKSANFDAHVYSFHSIKRCKFSMFFLCLPRPMFAFNRHVLICWIRILKCMLWLIVLHLEHWLTECLLLR